MFGLDYTVFRTHNVYGERQNIADRYRNVIGIFMNNLLKGKPMPVYGDGSQSPAFNHITDVAPVIGRAPLEAASRNEVFNVGADEVHSVLELAHTVAAVLDLPADVAHLPARNEVAHAFSDHSKARDVFGGGDPIRLDEGLARMAQWVRERGPQVSIEFVGEIEVRLSLPPSWRRQSEG